jgi:catechol 2,3-dioxygenase-like lactoylglutathione lyase family enzyme
MLGGSKLVAFLATADASRALPFYRDVLGLELESHDDFALVFDANGTRLRIARVREVPPAPYTVLGWHVDDIAKVVAALAAKGVTFEHYEGMGQDDAGIWHPPGGGHVAWFRDPDGNLLSLSQD